MPKRWVLRGVAGYWRLVVVRRHAAIPLVASLLVACGGNTDAGVSPEPEEPNLPNESRTLGEPSVNTEAVDRDGNDQSAPAGSTAIVGSVGGTAATVTDTRPSQPASSHTGTSQGTTGETIADDSGGSNVEGLDSGSIESTSSAPIANLECADGGCEKVCDLTNLLPLDTQEKVAALAAQECSVLTQGLTVSGALVNDLTGLSSIRRIGGDFVIQDTALASLSGLSGLVELEGTFVLTGNSELLELGFSLRNMGAGGLVVLSNPKLETLGGLASANFPTISVTIVDNAALASLAGLQMLTSAATLVVAQNASLTDVSALNGLGSVDNLTISENASLPAFELTALSFVTNMTIASNAALESVFLRCVGAVDVVTIQNNPELIEVTIPSLVATSLSVSQNPKLPQCSLQPLIDAASACSACDGNDTAALCEQE